MKTLFDTQNANPFEHAVIKPFIEMAAYEAIWGEQLPSFKKVAELFRAHETCRPSDLVDDDLLQVYYDKISTALSTNLKEWDGHFGLWVHGTLDYPERLRDAKDPVELLYYLGNPDLVNTRSVAIVGTRNPTVEGLARAKRLAISLSKDGFTIVSGLAKGIDTQAHNATIEVGGKTIAVIGTPLNGYYPPENKELQDRIGRDYLLISQIPFIRYSYQKIAQNRLFFPQRNITMSALTEATIIVEAGETSGTLIQARAALDQGRKLFILNSCFENRNISWPQKFSEKGAIRVSDYSDIEKHLA